MSDDVLQEIVDEQRGQIAKLVERIVELTEKVSSVTEDRRHAIAALSEDADRFRAERDESRREVCLILAGKCGKSAFVSADAIAEAQRRGWDCFSEATP